MKILTANRLLDGIAVWLAPDHSWTETIQAAAIARDEAVEDKLQCAGQAAFLKNEVVDVNMIDVELVDGAIEPKRLREKIRALGPSVRADLGKQAEPGLSRAA